MPRLYLSRGGVAYTPITIRGGWEQTSGHIVRGMHILQDAAILGSQQSITIAENSASGNFDVLLARAVSSPLAADLTFAGTLGAMLAVGELSGDSDLAYYLHVFVTQGDTDNLRGTLLANYADPLTNEWSSTAAGKALNAAQALSSVAALTGDRIVAEIGYRAYNTVSTTKNGTLWYGGNGSDLAAGGTPTSGVGYLDFSDAFTLVNNPGLRVSQLTAETLYRPSNAALRVTQMAQEVLRRPVPSLRATQFAIEVLRKNGVPAAASQGGMLVIAT